MNKNLPICLENIPSQYMEQINECVANGKLTLSPQAIISLIASKISTSKDNAVNPIDIVEVLKTAVSAGIDPTSSDIFAFKSKDTLTVGISKKGWSKILDARKGSVEYEYGPLVAGKTKLDKATYEYVAAKITRADGTVVTGPRIYSDEYNSSKGAWASTPKTMLTVRAFTQACALAYGIGAYDEAEAEEIYLKNQEQELPKVTLKTSASCPKPEPLDLKDIDSIPMLVNRFNSLSDEQKANSSIKDMFAKRRREIETKFEDIK